MKRFYLAVWIATLALASVVASHAASPAHLPKLVLLVAEPEYHTAESLAGFATQFLAKDFQVVTVTGSTADGENSFDHIDELKTADVVLISVRRRTPPAAEMKILKDYILSGHPVVGIRTASHAFVLREGHPKDGLADWPGWDEQIFGGSYTNHYNDGPVTEVTAVAPNHPILQGVKLPFKSDTKLYKVAPLKSNAQALLLGTIPGEKPEPIAYVAKNVGGGKSFYTSLGAPSDFANPAFQILLVNALHWAVQP